MPCMQPGCNHLCKDIIVLRCSCIQNYEFRWKNCVKKFYRVIFLQINCYKIFLCIKDVQAPGLVLDQNSENLICCSQSTMLCVCKISRCFNDRRTKYLLLKLTNLTWVSRWSYEQTEMFVLEIKSPFV